MTDPLPSPPKRAQSPPSLKGPVLFLAFASAFVLSMPVLFGAASVPVVCGQNCCGGITVSLLGILPARMVIRQGGVVSPGIGFVIPLLGVFMGGIIAAIVQVSFAPLQNVELRDNANQLFELVVADLERRGEPTDQFQRTDFVDFALFCGRYGVLLVAAASAVCAGAVGLVSTSIAQSLVRPSPGPKVDQESDPDSD
ncbi:MAG: hypothetical protein VX951_04950 [Planctomycetota bacterium]|nr:hypothetical protein [Planctomycetota bacterium]